MEEFFTGKIGLLFWSAVQAGQVKFDKKLQQFHQS